MPNWCSNNIEITGPETDVDTFVNTLTEHPDRDGHYSILNTFIPMPDPVDDWYKWAVTHWGTKWPDSMRIIERETTSVTLTGDTAWAPPLPGMTNVSKQFPTLTFILTYCEEGMCFMGSAVTRNGTQHIIEINDAFPSCDDWDDDDAVADYHDQLEDYKERTRKAALLLLLDDVTQ